MKFLIIAASFACATYVIYTVSKIVFMLLAAKVAKGAIKSNTLSIRHNLDV